jgi:trehalose 6-phosphate phosphatase
MSPTMQHLFSPEGLQALDEAMHRSPLLAFDFDGTLAPIVPHPNQAVLTGDLSRQLARLAERWPTAIVTGRSLADVTPRLGFTPRYIVGNHGAEEAGESLPAEARVALNELRQRIAQYQHALDEAEVHVEDKHHSLALHYRLASDHSRAMLVIQQLLLVLDPRLKQFGGKCVVNVTSARSPDKGDAIFSLVQRSSAGCAVFIGDDVNDEAVFARALPQWLTVRVGRDDPLSLARFVLDDPAEISEVLDRMLSTGPHPARPPPTSPGRSA